METILRNIINKHLEAYELIHDSQHGFRRGRSCLTNLLYFYDQVINELDVKNPVDIIFLDFEKAFDKVPHKRLIKKLNAHGICGNISKWIENWLTNRKQRVVLNGKASSWSTVTSGVPQGSVLGPLLFSIFINDIDEGLVSNVSKFADDTKIANVCGTKEGYNSIQEDLNKVTRWSEKWQMKFNTDKCKVMHIGKNNPRHVYLMNNTALIPVEEEKDLGIIINNDMKPSKQCTSAANKANRMLGFINRSLTYKNEQNVIKLYKSIVRPHLEYSVQAWSPYLKKDIIKLERIQRRATKMIPNLRHIPYEERLEKTKLFPLEWRRLRGDLIETFKIFNKINNTDCNKLFELSDNSLRNNGLKLKFKRFQGETARHTFTRRIPRSWNGLPMEVIASSSVRRFKTQLDRLHTIGALGPSTYSS